MCVRRPYTHQLWFLSPLAQKEILSSGVWPKNPDRLEPNEGGLSDHMFTRDARHRIGMRNMVTEAMRMHAYMPPRQAHAQVIVEEMVV
jgi:hypothetical protein